MRAAGDCRPARSDDRQRRPLHLAEHQGRRSPSPAARSSRRVRSTPCSGRRAAGRGKLAELRMEDVAPQGRLGGPFTRRRDPERTSRPTACGLAGSRTTTLQGGTAKSVIDAARRLIFQKGRDAHDYKFSSRGLGRFPPCQPGAAEPVPGRRRSSTSRGPATATAISLSGRGRALTS